MCHRCPHFLILLGFFTLTGLTSHGQDVDSIKAELPNFKGDEHVEVLVDLAWAYHEVDMDSALHYIHQAAELRPDVTNEQILSHAYHIQGSLYLLEARYDEGRDLLLKAYHLRKDGDDKANLAITLTSLSTAYEGLGDNTNTLKYILSADSIREVEDIRANRSNSIAKVAVAMESLDQIERAEELFLEGIEKHCYNDFDYALMHNNYANFLMRQGELNKAKEHLEISLGYEEKREDDYGIMECMANLGIVNYQLGNIDVAKDYLVQVYDHAMAFTNAYDKSTSANNLAFFHYLEGNYEPSLKLTLESLKYAKEAKASQLIWERYQFLSELHSTLGNYKEALSWQIKFQNLNDSLYTVEELKVRNELGEKYERAQKEKEILELSERNAVNALEVERKDRQIEEEEARNTRNTLIFSALGILGLILGGSIYYALVQKRKANSKLEEKNQRIEEQKLIVEEKNREILDSINYAKRIQGAILPPDRLVERYLSDSFILYKPKDIVAGDFYWMEPFAETPGSNGVLFAAADCTGHGVPGAMVSVVCHNAMNRAVREFGLTSPGAILDKTREIILKEFEQSDEDVKDGMDIALVSLTTEKSEHGSQTVAFSGANNPLWIVRKGSTEVEETKGDKQPIGKHEGVTPFTTHHFELSPGDTLYILSDGYVDQFGGDNGKKFKSSNLKKLLLSIHDKSMLEQRAILDNTFESWRGELEQLDDVCVIGVRV